MNDYDSLFGKICRICLSQGKSENMISLIDKSSADKLSCHGKAVIKFADVFLSSDDDLPSVICQNCVFLLKQAIYFKKRCELSDKQLKHMKKLSENSMENFKTSVCQYTMFLSYFEEEITVEKCRSIETTSANSQINSAVKTNENIEENSEMHGDFESDDNFNIFDDEFRQNDSLDKSLTFKDKNNSDTNDKLLDIIESTINTDMKITNGKYYGIRKNKTALNKKQRNFVCDICQKVLANAFTYDHHMQRHNGCRYICDQCGKGFAVLCQLNMHQVVRHGNGQYYQCNHCPYKAPRKLDLIEHLRLHTGERPYACEKCGLTFRRQAIWKKHLIRHTEKNVQCPQCPRKFYTQAALLDHKNNVHERRYVYVCYKCGVTYAKNISVRDHLRIKHGIPRDMQGKIERVFKSFPT